MIKLNGCTFKLRMAIYWKNVITKNFCKIKSYGDEAIDFHDKQIPKMDSNYTCLVVINLDSALKKYENYYLQVFLKECKYIEKGKKWPDIFLVI